MDTKEIIPLGKPLTRKQRRALDFGRAVMAEPRRPFYITYNTTIIPDTSLTRHNVLCYMMPYVDIPIEYKRDRHQRAEKPIATTLDDYREMLSVWFFSGLSCFKPCFKPSVSAETGDIDRAFKLYVRDTLESFEPTQEHKMAYLVFVCDRCCTGIEWGAK